ncbi:unnamed protein product [Dovyalis caffra]|uniref:Uncharacterized protein n=1 Tax=Dovyalis caffra TaxID=77055 RepID=A0AAV1RXR4_9ROSI|nr:unnamed protein product [Dovyalis caffra]
MSHQHFLSTIKKRANFRLCRVSSHTTELLEIGADDPKLHVLFIPGNPGIIAFYKDFLESLTGRMEGCSPYKNSLITRSRILSASVSFVLATLRLRPKWALRLIVIKIIGRSWSATAVEAVCSHLLQYHILRNILFMTMTEFKEISKQVPSIALSIEKEGLTPNFSCTEAGSVWVAR